jgi:EcsC protein family
MAYRKANHERKADKEKKSYDRLAMEEVRLWSKQMEKKPSFLNDASKRIQNRLNRLIPDRIHSLITTTIKQITRAVIFGADFTTPAPRHFNSLEEAERHVYERITFYRRAAATEGALTGVGGIWLGFADFPLWLMLKMKMLFEISASYGFKTSDYRERIYILYIFQLTFSSHRQRKEVFSRIRNWDAEKESLPEDINQFDWRSFQQNYRDYIDLAKMLQLIPGVGAAVGAFVNHRLTGKLGKMAMNAYRLRCEAMLDK